MEFRAAYIPQVREYENIKTLVENLSKDCEVTYSISFTFLKSGFRFDADTSEFDKKRLLDAAHASQVAFMQILNCMAGLKHYMPELKQELMFVNTDREGEPWLFFALILEIEGDGLPPSEGLDEFIKYFQLSKEIAGKQIRLFKKKPNSRYELEEIKDLSSLAAKPSV